MKNNIKLLVILLGFVVPYILIYRAFFVSGPLAFGDAPYFYPEKVFHFTSVFKTRFVLASKNIARITVTAAPDQINGL